MAVTDVPMTALIAVSLALAVTGRLEWAGVAAGLAASAKYPAVFLIVPLVVAGWGRWRRLAVAVGLAAAAFLATSPYVLVHPGQAWDDATRVQRLAREGWLGFEHDSFALFSFTGKLWAGLGPALVVAVLGLVLALRRRTRTDLILAAFVLVYLADLLTIRAHFDRYVLPLVPPLAVLAGRQRLLAPLTLGLLIVPLVWAIGDDVRLTRTDTRAVAHAWIVAAHPARDDDRRRVVDAGARGLPDRRPRPARAGSAVRPRPRRRAAPRRGSPVRARHRSDRRPRARRARAVSARGAVLRRSASPGKTGLPCRAWARVGRALGRPLPPVIKRLLLIPIPFLALALAGCGGASSDAIAPTSHPASARACPKAWQASWQKLANRIHAPVYCPSWLPDPLTGEIGGSWNNIDSVSPDRSYLIGFVWQELGQEIHINLRGYPGVTKVPTCRSVELVGGKRVEKKVPCFADSQRPEDDRRRARHRVHGQPGRRPVARPLRLDARRQPVHAQPARCPAADVPEGRAVPEPDDGLARPRPAQGLSPCA